MKNILAKGWEGESYFWWQSYQWKLVCYILKTGGRLFFEPIAPNLTAKWHAISISWYDMTSSFLKQSFFRRKGHNSPAKIKFPSSQTAKTVIKVISNSKKPFACFMLLKTTNYILESLKAHWLKWYPWLWQLQISFFMSPQYFFHFFPLLFSGCVTRPWQSKDKGKGKSSWHEPQIGLVGSL